MRWVSQQQAIRAAVGSVVAALSLGIAGCDALQGDNAAADRKAMDLVQKKDYQAAAAEKNTSPAVASLSAAMAANAQYDASVPAFRRLASNQISINETLWALDQLVGEAQTITDSSQGVARQNPQEILDTLDQSAQQVKGEQAKQWAPTGVQAESIAIPTISAATAEANALKDKIGELERNIAQLKKQRAAVQTTAQKLADESSAATGEQSVDLFRQAAEHRKAAMTLGIQLDQLEASLIPLRQDLDTAQAMQEVGKSTLQVYADSKENIEKGWRAVTAASEERAKQAEIIFGGVEQQQQQRTSIASQNRQLVELMAEREKDAASFEQQIRGSIASAGNAAKSASDAVRELQSAGKSTADSVKIRQSAMDPSGARFAEANAQFSLGAFQLAQTNIYGGRARLATRLAVLSQKLNQKLPETMDAASLTAQKQEWATRANESFSGAADNFDKIYQAPLASPALKQSGSTGQMLALAASAVLATENGDDAAAKQHLDQAKALRDRLLETNTALPTLPQELQGGIPASRPAEQPPQP